jgi:hypothetical protein
MRNNSVGQYFECYLQFNVNVLNPLTTNLTFKILSIMPYKITPKTVTQKFNLHSCDSKYYNNTTVGVTNTAWFRITFLFSFSYMMPFLFSFSYNKIIIRSSYFQNHPSSIHLKNEKLAVFFSYKVNVTSNERKQIRTCTHYTQQ